LPYAAGPGRRILEELDLADMRMMVMVAMSLFSFFFFYCLVVDLQP
jgi:hypothetical protein